MHLLKKIETTIQSMTSSSYFELQKWSMSTSKKNVKLTFKQVNVDLNQKNKISRPIIIKTTLNRKKGILEKHIVFFDLALNLN